MRKVLVFALAAGMLGAGLYGVFFELEYAAHIFWRLVIGAGLLAAFGGYLLWTDFVAPRFGIKTWED